VKIVILGVLLISLSTVHARPTIEELKARAVLDDYESNIVFGYNGTSSDVGRGVAYDIDPRYRGYETWGAGGPKVGVSSRSSAPARRMWRYQR